MRLHHRAGVGRMPHSPVVWPPVLMLAALAGCAALPGGHSEPDGEASLTHRVADAFTLSIVGTNDLHGEMSRLPVFGGYVANLRTTRRLDGGAVILLDAGDMFQGTLESNWREGSDVVDMYNQLGYAAAAIGNHEFDFGPLGPAASPRQPSDDPRGALKARALQAKFPLLVANLLRASTSAQLGLPNVADSTVVTLQRSSGAAPFRIGIVGLATEKTLRTTVAANVHDLAMVDTATSVVAQAKQLRAAGVNMVIATMHIGSSCTDFRNVNDNRSCDRNTELFHVLESLPPGTLDLVVAGHTHAAIAHRIAGVPVIQSYASGKAFGRVDVRVNEHNVLESTTVFPPQELCPTVKSNNDPCLPAPYEGRPVVEDPTLQGMLDAALAKTTHIRSASLGPIPFTYAPSPSVACGRSCSS